MSGAFFASSAIRCCFVETVVDFDISSSLSHQQFSIPAPLHCWSFPFPPQDPIGWFSRFNGTVGVLRVADAHLVSPRYPSALTIPIRHAFIRSLGGCARPASGQGALITRGPYFPLYLRIGDTCASQVPWLPFIPSPCSPTPEGSRRPHLKRRRDAACWTFKAISSHTL